MTKSQVDRLGDRLRKADVTEPDLRLLDEYRRSFATAYTEVVRVIRDKLELEPTGRPAKSTTSIAEKLRRESIRLSQVQDIAGCRVVVADPVEQDGTVAHLAHHFPKTSIVDRRDRPSHGYRAVHLIVEAGGRLVEIQVRTALQHMWAEVSEKFSDVYDPEIKYGAGPTPIRSLLTNLSDLIARAELNERRLASMPLTSSTQDMLHQRETLAEVKRDITNLLADLIAKVTREEGESSDIPD